MGVKEIITYEFTEETFIKDYKKTAEILDAETRRTIRRMNEIASRT